MGTSEATLERMSEATRTVVKILEENWPRIRQSCNYFEKGKKCPLTEETCSFSNCELLNENNGRNRKNEGKKG